MWGEAALVASGVMTRRLERWVALAALLAGGFALLANCSSSEEEAPSTVRRSGSDGGSGGSGGAGTSKGGSSAKAGGAGSPGTGGAKLSACSSTTALTVSDIAAGDEVGVLVGKGVAGGETYTVRIELNEEGMFKQAPGMFDLAEQPDYGACNHCVVVYQGESVVTATKAYFQARGKLSLDMVTSPPTGVSKGTLEQVELLMVKVEQGTGALTEDASKSCLSIDKVSWSTEPPKDKPCEGAADCGDVMTSACDPQTRKCVSMACSLEDGSGCGTGLCLAQTIGATHGACYPTCVPFDPGSTCPPMMTCEPLDLDLLTGKCMQVGTGQEGSSCEITGVSTGCAEGLRCVGDEGAKKCLSACNFFDDPGKCDAGKKCAFGGVCTPDAGDAAALGAPCGAGVMPGTPCAADGNVLRGVCVAEGAGTTCLQPCRLGNVYIDCDEGTKCRQGEDDAAIAVCRVVP